MHHETGEVIPEAVPRFATKRRPERKSFGWLARVVAVMLGEQLMPWQEDAIDVILEYKITSFGVEFYYDTWFYTVPRQSGKTLLAFVWMITRCLVTPGSYVWTAQDHTKAGKKWVNELFPKFNASPELKSFGKTYLSNGKEAIKFAGGTSVMEIGGSGSEDGHGPTRRGAGCDEIWNVDRSIMDGLGPSLSTADAQLGLFSTAGDEGSEFFDDQQKAGREAVLADAGEGMAYFEYAAEIGTDPEDETLWYQYMPALGHITTIRTIRTNLRRFKSNDNDIAGFVRAFLNIPDKSNVVTIVDPDKWKSMQRSWPANELRASDDVSFGLHIGFDRNVAVLSVAVAGRQVGVVKTYDDLTDVAEEVNKVTAQFETTVAVAGNTQAATLLDLKRTLVVSATHLPLVCSAALELMNAGELQIKPHDGLTDAVASAVKHRTGERWVWKATKTSVPLWSVTMALASSILSNKEVLNVEPVATESFYENHDLIVF